MKNTLSVVLLIWIDSNPDEKREWYRDLDNTLDSLDWQTVKADEVIVVNMGPSKSNINRIREIAERHNVTHIEAPAHKFSMSWGFNVGIKRAKSEYIATVGYEMIFSQGAIESVKELMQPDRILGGVCGFLPCDADLSDPLANWDKLRAPLVSRQHGRSNNFCPTTGTITVMHRDQWHRLRGYNEDFPFYGGGTGTVLRAVNGGIEYVVVPHKDAIWLHPWHKQSLLVTTLPIPYKFIDAPVVCNPDGWGVIDMDADPLLCVIGMPRSGTIWITRLIAQAIDSPSQTRYKEGSAFDYDKDPAVWGEERPGGLIRRLHVVSGPRAYQYQSPVVLVVRDPRSIAVSHIYYSGREEENEGIFDSHFRWIARRWIKYYGAWIKDDRVVATVRYEDMLRNPQVELSNVIMGILRARVPTHRMPSPKEIAAAVEDNSFDRMENWAKGKGIQDNWKTHLSEESMALWRRRAENSVMKELGYAA